MITNVKATTSTGNATRYLLRRPPGHAEIIGGTIAHTNPNAIAAEFKISESIGHHQLEKPGYHISLSYHPDDSPTNEQMATIAEAHLAGMVVSGEQPELLRPGNEADYQAAVQHWLDNRAGDFQYLIVRHNDTNHQHAHLIASRVDMASGKAIERDYDRYRTQMIARQLEKQHGLTKQESSWEVNKREGRHKKSQLEKLEDQADQYFNEIDDAQQERLEAVEQLTRTIPDGEWREYQLRTTGKGRSLSHKNLPIVEWHQQGGATNHHIKQSDIRALQDWQRQLAELRLQKKKAELDKQKRLEQEAAKAARTKSHKRNQSHDWER